MQTQRNNGISVSIVYVFLVFNYDITNLCNSGFTDN